MRKNVIELKKGDKIKIAGKIVKVEEIECAEFAGKSAVPDKKVKKKCRIVTLTEDGERIVIIRPEDYPFEVL